MSDRMIAVPDRDLSLWQSIAEEKIRKGELPAPRPGAASADELRTAIATHATHQAMSDPIPGDFNTFGGGGGGGAAESDSTHIAYASRAFFNLAQAKRYERYSEEEIYEREVEYLEREYSSAAWWPWVKNCYLAFVAHYGDDPHAKPVYRDWNKSPKKKDFSVIEYKLPVNAKVMILGDWGTDLTDNVEMLKRGIEELRPDAVIHLGDIYYSGTKDECRRNVLEPYARIFSELGRARVPFFAIPGNHEYYSGGAGFYEILDKINAGNAAWKQEASYFCLRTEDSKWQFLGMDTGYDSYNIIPSSTGPELVSSEVEWHKHKLDTFSGSTILLSHHQLFSAHSPINWSPTSSRAYLNESLHKTFEPYFIRRPQKPRRKDKIAAWFWGHEHNFVAFENNLFDVRRGRLIGCGAYQESVNSNPYKNNFPDAVRYQPSMKQVGKSQYGDDAGKFYNHAFALLEFSAAGQVQAKYYQYPSWGREYNGSRPKLSDPALQNPFYEETIDPVP